MSEAGINGVAPARVLFAVLLFANLLVLGYSIYAPEPGPAVATRIEDLQINAERITLNSSAVRGPGGEAPAAKGPDAGACLEWGPFAAADLARAESALARLALADKPLQRPAADADAGGAKRFAYYLRDPDTKTVAQFAELQRAFAGTQIRATACPKG